MRNDAAVAVALADVEVDVVTSTSSEITSSTSDTQRMNSIPKSRRLRSRSGWLPSWIGRNRLGDDDDDYNYNYDDDNDDYPFDDDDDYFVNTNDDDDNNIKSRICSLAQTEIVQLRWDYTRQQFERVFVPWQHNANNHVNTNSNANSNATNDVGSDTDNTTTANSNHNNNNTNQKINPHDIVWARECWCARTRVDSTSTSMGRDPTTTTTTITTPQNNKQYCLAQYDVCQVDYYYPNPTSVGIAADSTTVPQSQQQAHITCYSYTANHYDQTLTTARSLSMLCMFWFVMCTVLLVCTVPGRQSIAYVRRMYVVGVWYIHQYTYQWLWTPLPCLCGTIYGWTCRCAVTWITCQNKKNYHQQQQQQNTKLQRRKLLLNIGNHDDGDDDDGRRSVTFTSLESHDDFYFDDDDGEENDDNDDDPFPDIPHVTAFDTDEENCMNGGNGNYDVDDSNDTSENVHSEIELQTRTTYDGNDDDASSSNSHDGISSTNSVRRSNFNMEDPTRTGHPRSSNISNINHLPRIPTEFGNATNYRQLLSEFYHMNIHDPDTTAFLWNSALQQDPTLFRTIQGGNGLPRMQSFSGQQPQQQQQQQQQQPQQIQQQQSSSSSSSVNGQDEEITDLQNNTDGNNNDNSNDDDNNTKNNNVRSTMMVIPPPHIRTDLKLFLKTKRYSRCRTNNNSGVNNNNNNDDDDDGNTTNVTGSLGVNQDCANGMAMPCDDDDDGVVHNNNDKDDEDTRNQNNNDDDDVTCSICLCDIEEGDIVGDLDCGHVLHKECLKIWLQRGNRCPLCQQDGLATPRTTFTVGTAFDVDTLSYL